MMQALLKIIKFTKKVRLGVFKSVNITKIPHCDKKISKNYCKLV